MGSGLLRGDIPPRDQHLHQGVVTADLLNLPVVDVIAAAIPYVDHIGLLVQQQCRHQGGPHPTILLIGAGELVDVGVGLVTGLAEQLGTVLLPLRDPILAQLLQFRSKTLHCNGAGHIARSSAAHTVADHRNGHLLAELAHGIAVLVLTAYRADIRHSKYVHRASSFPGWS